MGDNIARRMRFACWIIKATHTASLSFSLSLSHTHTRAQCVKLTAFALQQLVGKHAPILRYTIIACLHVMLHISNCLLLYIQKKLRIKLPFSDFHKQIIQIPCLSIILKWILQEYDERLWAVFNCFNT